MDMELEIIELAIQTKKVLIGTITFNLEDITELEARAKEIKRQLRRKLKEMLKNLSRMS